MTIDQASFRKLSSVDRRPFLRAGLAAVGVGLEPSAMRSTRATKGTKTKYLNSLLHAEVQELHSESHPPSQSKAGLFAQAGGRFPDWNEGEPDFQADLLLLSDPVSHEVSRLRPH